MKTLNELKQDVDDYFSDTSRSQFETADGLREIADMCNTMAEAIESDIEENT